MTVMLVILLFSLSAALECPTKCNCTNYKTLCRWSKLYTLPSQLSASTESLSIQYDYITKLTTSMVTSARLNNLIHLKLDQVQLQEIEPGSFKNMNLLEKLIITNNYINVLQADTFKYLNNLYYLDLKFNGVTHMDDGVFSDLLNLRYLYLSAHSLPLRANIFSNFKNSSNCEAMKTPGVLKLYDAAYVSSYPYDFDNYTDFKAFQPICLFTKIYISGSRLNYIPRDAFIGATRVTHLQLQHITLKKLTNFFNGLTKLLTLVIFHTLITDIEIGAFESLICLKYLDLSHNEFREIKTDTFRGLQSLEQLILNHNEISTLEKNAFKGLESLQKLSLDHCRISIISNDVFISLNNLRELLIYFDAGGQIDSLDSFNSLTQIKEIYLRVGYSYQHYTHHRNVISLKNNTFSKLKALVTLNLPRGLYSIQAQTFPELWSIQIFSKNISHRLEHIYYQDIKYEITLQRISFIMAATFCETEIRASVKSVQGHQTLQELQLKIHGNSPNLKNQLRELLENTVNFTQLKVKITGTRLNLLETLPTLSGFQTSELILTFGTSLILTSNTSFGFPNVQSLTIDGITTLEIHANALMQLKSLTSMIIYDNRHVAIAQGTFAGLYNLQTLTIDKNRNVNGIKQFEAGMFRGLDNLKTLLFSNSFSIPLIRGMFQGLYNIIEIDLSWNGIKEIIPGVFGADCVDFKLSCKNVTEPSPYCNDTHALKTLQHLYLSDNKIQHIHQHAFISCFNLKTLVLENNHMLTLETTFLYLPGLTKLNMIECNVTNIPNNTFDCTPNISELLLELYNVTLYDNIFLPLKQLKRLIIRSPPDSKPTCRHFNMSHWIEYKRGQTTNYEKKQNYYDTLHTTTRRMSHSVEYKFTQTKTYETKDTRNFDFNYLDRFDINIQFYKLNCISTNRKNQKPLKVPNNSLYMKEYVEPIILTVITTSGIVFNGFLLFVSLWNCDMRTKHNSCIIHLSITDTLSLILNLPLSYWNTLHVSWELGVLTCKMFMFLKDVTLVANIFSVVALSVERFHVARISKDLKKSCKTDYPIWWLLTMTWVSGITLSIPAYYNASVHTRCLYCPPGNQEYIKNVWIYQFIVHYFLPAVVICALNTMTSLYLRKSVKNLPGIVNDNIRMKNRITVANIVTILSAIFVFSYLPNFTLRILVAWSVIDIDDVLVYSFVSFCLFYSGTLFNPISIFIMSSKYKNYFFKYFPFLKNNTDTKNSPIAKKTN